METVFTKDANESLFTLPELKTEQYLAETIEVPFDTLPILGQTSICTIPHRTDRIRRITVRTKLPQLYFPIGPGYVYPVYTDQVDGSVFVQTNTLAIQPGDFVGYFNTQQLNFWATNFVSYNLAVTLDATLGKFVFTSNTYSNIFFKNEGSASFWGFDIRSFDFLTSGGYWGYNITNGTLTSPLTLIQSGWIKGFTPPPTTGFSYKDSAGTRIVKEARLLIGGQTIDRISSERLYIEQDLKIPLERQVALTALEGKNDTSGIYAPREFYTKLTFDTDFIDVSSFERHDLKVEVDFQTFVNLASNLITSNGMTDGASYTDVNWKAINGIYTGGGSFVERVFYVISYKKYIIYISKPAFSTGTFYTFYFYDTTKPIGDSTSWTRWKDPTEYRKLIGRPFTIGGYIYYFLSLWPTIQRTTVDTMLSNTATTQSSSTTLINRYYRGDILSMAADARYLYMLCGGCIYTIGSNTMTLVSYVGDNLTLSNLRVTFNVFEISTSTLIATDLALFKTKVLELAPDFSVGRVVNVTSNVKTGTTLTISCNVQYASTVTVGDFLFQSFAYIVVRYDSTKDFTSTSSYDWLTLPGTNAPKTSYDFINYYYGGMEVMHLSSDGRYLYYSTPSLYYSYLHRLDTFNFLTDSSYTAFNVKGSINPVPDLRGGSAEPVTSDGSKLYLQTSIDSSYSVTNIPFYRYNSTKAVTDTTAYELLLYPNNYWPVNYGFIPMGFDGRYIYYTGSTGSNDIALTILRIDSVTFTVKDWIIFRQSAPIALTSDGTTINVPQLLCPTGMAVPVVNTGSRYIYLSSKWYGGTELYLDFLQIDPLTMTQSFDTSVLVKYETSETPITRNETLYSQTDLNTFTIPSSVQFATFPLEFSGPIRELWITIDQPAQIQQLTFKNNGDILFDEDQSVTKVLRPYKFYTNMPTQSNLYVYNFALDPEHLKPTGSLNFSRLFYPTLDVKLTAPATSNIGVRVYSKNFNILKAEYGLAGLEFYSSI
jgi:hypothetical protein